MFHFCLCYSGPQERIWLYKKQGGAVMKGLSVRLEDEFHRRLRRVVFEKDISLQDFVLELLITAVEAAEEEGTA